jgi:hypothetical protein
MPARSLALLRLWRLGMVPCEHVHVERRLRRIELREQPVLHLRLAG